MSLSSSAFGSSSEQIETLIWEKAPVSNLIVDDNFMSEFKM